MDMKKFLDYCADHACGGAELTSYYFPEKVTDEYLRDVRRHAHLRGVTISGTAVGNDFCHPLGEKRNAEIASVKEWIRKAAILGAPHIRVFTGGPHGTTEAEAVKLAIAALEECGEEAGKAGIFLGSKTMVASFVVLNPWLKLFRPSAVRGWELIWTRVIFIPPIPTASWRCARRGR